MNNSTPKRTSLAASDVLIAHAVFRRAWYRVTETLDPDKTVRLDDCLEVPAAEIIRAGKNEIDGGPSLLRPVIALLWKLDLLQPGKWPVWTTDGNEFDRRLILHLWRSYALKMELGPLNYNSDSFSVCSVACAESDRDEYGFCKRGHCDVDFGHCWRSVRVGQPGKYGFQLRCRHCGAWREWVKPKWLGARREA